MSFNEGLTVARFCDQVDFLVEFFRLDPELPEIKDLKGNVSGYVATLADPMEFLRTLNPRHGASWRSSSYVEIIEANGALRSWSLARYYVPGLDKRLMSVGANHSGVYLKTSDGVVVAILEGSVGNVDMADS